MVSTAQIWEWLEHVPDPEIPVISLVDLGVVRAVDVQAGAVVVTVTPTYSGCPATRIIEQDIVAALHKHGVKTINVVQVLSPPWTTEWMSAQGIEKLRKYGISPPVSGAPIACPQCSSEHVEKISQFGSTPCKASYRCLDCLEPFDHFKCI